MRRFAYRGCGYCDLDASSIDGRGADALAGRAVGGTSGSIWARFFAIVLGGIASGWVVAEASAWFRAILGDTCGKILCGTGRAPSVAGYLNTTFR